MYGNLGSSGLAYTGIAGVALSWLLGVGLALVAVGVILTLLALGPRIALEPVRSGSRRRLRVTFNGRAIRRRP